MSLRQRTLILAVIGAIAAGAYSLALHFSPLLVYRVVEQTLIQKAPAGVARVEIENRLRAHLETISNDSERLQRLLAISQYLEKTQRLREEELKRILGGF